MPSIIRKNIFTHPQIWVNKFGDNPDIDSGAAEDIWSQGGKWVAPTQARIHNLTGAAADNGTSTTGALTVEVEGLDADFMQIIETVTLDGATGVNTVNSYIRIFRMIVLTAGSGGSNVGAILATAAVDATVTASIPIGENQTHMAIYTTADNMTGYLTQFDIHVDPTNALTFTCKVLTRINNGPYVVKFTLILTADAPGVHHEFNPPLILEPRTDVLLEGTSSINNLEVSGSFDINCKI